MYVYIYIYIIHTHIWNAAPPARRSAASLRRARHPCPPGRRPPYAMTKYNSKNNTNHNISIHIINNT